MKRHTLPMLLIAVCSTVVGAASPQALFLRMLVVESRQQAEEAMRRLQGGERFHELAKEISIDPNRVRGGYLGRVRLDRLNDQFRKVVLDLRPGAYSPFFQSGSEWVSLLRLPSDFRDEARRLQSDADRLRKEGRFAEAIESYLRALDVDPDFIHAWFGLGVAYGEAGQTGREVESYRRAIQIEPDFHMAHYNLGKVLMEQGDAPGAMRSFREAVRIRPDLPEAYVNLSALHLAAGDAESAAKAARTAVDLNPILASAHYNLGLAVAARDLPAALESFKTAAAIDPGRKDARLNLGIALARLARKTEALAEIEKLLEDFPDFEPARRALSEISAAPAGYAANNPEPVTAPAGNSDSTMTAQDHQRLGKQALLEGRVGEGLDHFEAAAALEPDSAEIRNQLAWVLVAWGKEQQARGQWSAAAQSWRRALAVETDFIPALKALVEAKVIEGDFGEAERLLTRASGRNPDDPDLLILRSRLAYERREIEKSFQELTKLDFSSLGIPASLRVVEQLLYLDLDEQAERLVGRLQLQPRERFELANIYIKFDRFEPAEKILGQMPAVSARLLLGRLYSEQLRFREAEDAFQSILAEDPSSWPAYFFLGQVYLDSGVAEKAIPLYQKAHLLQPDNVNVMYKLGDAYSRSNQGDKALEWLSRGLDLEPRSFQLNFSLARLLLDRGETAEAKRHFGLVLEQEPDHIRTHYLLGRLYQQEGDAETARRYLGKFNELKQRLEAGREQLNVKKDALKGRVLIS